MNIGDYCTFVVFETHDDVTRLTIADGKFIFKDDTYSYIFFRDNKVKIENKLVFANYYEAISYITQFFLGILTEVNRKVGKQ